MFKKHKIKHLGIDERVYDLKVKLDKALEQILQSNSTKSSVRQMGYTWWTFNEPVPTLKGSVDLLISKLEALEQYLKVSYQEPKTLNVKGEYTKK